jgi:hypothetical protein
MCSLVGHHRGDNGHGRQDGAGRLGGVLDGDVGGAGGQVGDESDLQAGLDLLPWIWLLLTIESTLVDRTNWTSWASSTVNG